MTVPMEYWNASKDFEKCLADIRDTCMLQTHHQAYQTLRAVLHVFRSHLSVKDALAFANVLPPLTRAIFIENWSPDDNPPVFPSRKELQMEVKAVRSDHNLAPETAIIDVATALRRSSMNNRDLDHVLQSFPSGAAEFWATLNN
jgi:uncharacterized protein (DUF2267 family)